MKVSRVLPGVLWGLLAPLVLGAEGLSFDRLDLFDARLDPSTAAWSREAATGGLFYRNQAGLTLAFQETSPDVWTLDLTPFLPYGGVSELDTGLVWLGGEQGLLLVPEYALRRSVIIEAPGPAYADALAAANVGTLALRSRLAAFLQAEAPGPGPRRLWLVPYTPVRVGGSGGFLAPTALRVTGLALGAEGQARATVVVAAQTRGAQPRRTVAEVGPRLILISPRAKDVELVEAWRGAYPLVDHDRAIPLVVYLGRPARTTPDLETALRRFTGLTLAELEAQAKGNEVRWFQHQWRDGTPATLVVLARSAGAVIEALGADPAFRGAVEAFYRQEFGPVVP